MAYVLSAKADNVALISRLLESGEEILLATSEASVVEAFFSSQRAVYDEALALQRSFGPERDYFASDPDTLARMRHISSVLAMEKPYESIDSLIEPISAVKAAYQAALAQKKEEAGGIAQECMGDVHTLAGVGGPAAGEVQKSDLRFSQFKRNIEEEESLSSLDAMITQLLSYKDQVCRKIEILLGPSMQGVSAQKIASVRRYEVFPVRRMASADDVDDYLEEIRKKLYGLLESNDAVQLS